MNDCLFCKIIDGSIPSKKIYESDSVIAFLDINPKKYGHTLVVPKKHIKDIYEISNDEYGLLKEETVKVMNIINEKLNPKGIMVITNTGSFQEIKHLHIHLVPEYDNDEDLSLDETYNKLVN